MKQVHIVSRNMGIDGSCPMFAFSNESVAIEVCAMYNDTTESGEYDFFSYSSMKVDEYPFSQFRIVKDEDGDTTLEW